MAFAGKAPSGKAGRLPQHLAKDGCAIRIRDSELRKKVAGARSQVTWASVLSRLIVDNTPSLPRPSPPWGRGWTATGVFFSRGGPGEGVPAKLLVVNNNAGQDTRWLGLGKQSRQYAEGRTRREVIKTPWAIRYS
jgi:hypothetical protein